jgi:hypothetical protein
MTGVCGLREPTKTYFAVLILEEAAQSLNINERTARRWWDYSRACLLKELSEGQV